MKNNICKRKLLLVLLIISIFLCFSAFTSAECLQLNTLLSGENEIPVCVTVSSPAFHILSGYGENRCEELNRLLKHFSVAFILSGNETETAVSIDSEQAFSFCESLDNDKLITIYSFNPDKVYYTPADQALKEDSMNSFLDRQFFRINRLMDDLYPLFEKTAVSFPDLSGTEKVSLNFRKFGKAVRRLTIRFSSAYVKDCFPRVLCDLTDSAECRLFLNQLFFDGPQRIILLFDAEDRLIRVGYDGSVGLAPESLRKVSINWKCLRIQDQKMDDITLKSPAVKGYDKYNMSFSRELDLTDPEQHMLSWNFELDLKSGDIRKKIQFVTELKTADETLTGKSSYVQKQDGREEKTEIIPSIKKENDKEYNGLLEITNYSGKIMNSRMETRLHISACDPVKIPENKLLTAINSESSDRQRTENDLRFMLSSILIHKLISLPQEDIQFLRKDIPEETWSTITNSLFLGR